MNPANLLDQNIGIPRARMPQLAGFPGPHSKAAELPRDPVFHGVDLGPVFWAELVKQGHHLKHYREDVAKLKPTQDDLNMDKVRAIAARIKAGELPEQCLFISSDNHIVDGHHRWAACLMAGVDTVPVSRIDMRIHDVIRAALAFDREWGPLQ